MMGMHRQPGGLDAWTIFLVVAYFIAIVSTMVRLGYKIWRRQFCWDDFWALVALLATIVTVVILFILSLVPMDGLSIGRQSFILWVTFFMHPIEMWASRLSIGVTIVRLLPPGRTSNVSKLSCLVLFAMLLTVVVQKVWMCGSTVPKLPYCRYTKVTPALGLVTNVTSNAWLIAWPAYILVNMKLPKTHRRLLIACFSTSLLVSVINIFHDVFFLVRNMIGTAVTGHLEMSVSLFLCNLLVLVTYLYHYSRPPNNPNCGSESEEPSERTERSLAHLQPMSAFQAIVSRPLATCLGRSRSSDQTNSMHLTTVDTYDFSIFSGSVGDDDAKSWTTGGSGTRSARSVHSTVPVRTRRESFEMFRPFSPSDVELDLSALQSPTLGYELNGYKSEAGPSS